MTSKTEFQNEITFRSIIVGIMLAILLCASTTYVGLKVGRTIAGSIPAAVISMALLRNFKGNNVLENNIVQTAASAGEVVSAGTIFTIPALIITGYWQEFSYWETTSIVLVGGLLGVFFSVPLRKIMIVEKNLPYPEGVATAAILSSGNTKGGAKFLASGGVLAGFIASLQEVFHIVATEFQYWVRTPFGITGVGIEFSPVLVGAGYIIGARVAAPIIVGTIITWVIGIPLYCNLYGFPDHITTDAFAAVIYVWKTKFRFVGVGAMLVGGIWSFVSIIGSMTSAIKDALNSVKTRKQEARKNQDINFKYVLYGIILSTIPLYIIFKSAFTGESLFFTFLAIILVLIFGFIIASTAAYLTGIVGSTCLPTSGMTISAILIFSMILILFNGSSIGNYEDTKAFHMVGSTIIFSAFIALSSSLSADNMQDLKAGQLVGATPWRQQVMLIVGVISAALVIVPILNLLYKAYGFMDAPNANPALALAAPQASLMATVAKGVFMGGIEWNMLYLGIFIGIIVIIIDAYLTRKKSTISLPVLSIALGIFLPMSYIIPLVVGGIVASILNYQKSKANKKKDGHDDLTSLDKLFASGMIAGHAIVGVLVAIPIANGFDFSRISPDLSNIAKIFFGFISYAIVFYSIVKINKLSNK